MGRSKVAPFLLLAGSLGLGGCVAGMAASALGAAVQSAQPRPQGNEALKPQAARDCTAHAAQSGTVHIIDVEQRTPSRIIVWGTVTNAGVRQSFECNYTTRIVRFQLRPIRA